MQSDRRDFSRAFDIAKPLNGGLNIAYGADLKIILTFDQFDSR